METNIYEVKSAKEVHLEYLHQGLNKIFEDYNTDGDSSKIQQVPALNYLLLTTGNHRFVLALLKSGNYLIKKIK